MARRVMLYNGYGRKSRRCIGLRAARISSSRTLPPKPRPVNPLRARPRQELNSARGATTKPERLQSRYIARTIGVLFCIGKMAVLLAPGRLP